MQIEPSSFKTAFDEMLPQLVSSEFFEDENTDKLMPWREPAVGTYADLFTEMRKAGAAPWRLQRWPRSPRGAWRPPRPRSEHLAWKWGRASSSQVT